MAEQFLVGLAVGFLLGIGFDIAVTLILRPKHKR